MKSSPILVEWEVPPREDLPDEWFTELLDAFRVRLGFAGRGVSLLLAGDDRLRELNQTWRGMDKPTDILSWAYEESEHWGDLALSVERAAAQAQENGWDVPTETARLLAHGMAHLAGYDHHTPAQEQEMRAVEDDLLAQAGFPGLYPPWAE
ncbi:MAG: rRNA maturation RNase YbeY [Deltaproteobacteria bacterium]|nr:rRNA maturation RNase YbeY [Deltaproteobacteria bacterium]